MEFGILGSLQVRDESGTRAVAAAKQRALLAVLLLRSGCVVPLGTIADLIWDGRPPGSALSSLRNYVMRLRRVLGPAGERIVGREGGYLVEVDADELDLLRFNRLRQEGASAFDRGDYALAGTLLAETLDEVRKPGAQTDNANVDWSYAQVVIREHDYPYRRLAVANVRAAA